MNNIELKANKYSRERELRLSVPDNMLYDTREGARAYAHGYKQALKDIKHEIDMCAVEQNGFPILHLLDFCDKNLGLK